MLYLFIVHGENDFTRKYYFTTDKHLSDEFLEKSADENEAYLIPLVSTLNADFDFEWDRFSILKIDAVEMIPSLTKTITLP